jgi:hypothetical protein
MQLVLQAWVDNRMSSAGTVAAPLAAVPGGRQAADYYPSGMLGPHTPQRNRGGGPNGLPAAVTPLAAGRGRPMGVRASYNERLATRYQPSHQHYHPPPLTAAAPVRELVYRSNSSLELEQDEVIFFIFMNLNVCIRPYFLHRNQRLLNYYGYILLAKTNFSN